MGESFKVLLESGSLGQIMTKYGESHQNPSNQIIHKICVPLIVWSLFGALYHAHPMADIVALGLALGYFFRFRSLKLIVAMTVFVLPTLVISRLELPGHLEGCVVVFVLAWIGQFIGHKIEGKKPSFFEDVFFLLIGPLWVLKFILVRGDQRS